jgi:hypothetical protein
VQLRELGLVAAANGGLDVRERPVEPLLERAT